MYGSNNDKAARHVLRFGPGGRKCPCCSDQHGKDLKVREHKTARRREKRLVRALMCEEME